MFVIRFIDKAVKFLIALFGVFLFLFVSNLVNFTPKYFIFFNGDRLLMQLNQHRAANAEIKRIYNMQEINLGIFYKHFVGGDSGLITAGIFNPLAQKIVILLVAAALLIITSHFLFRKTSDSVLSYEWAKIILKSTILLLAITSLDYHLIAFHQAAVMEWNGMEIFVWLTALSIGGLVFSLTTGSKIKSLLEFGFVLSLLISMIVLNHQTYCAQNDFKRPLLSFYTSECTRL